MADLPVPFQRLITAAKVVCLLNPPINGTRLLAGALHAVEGSVEGPGSDCRCHRRATQTGGFCACCGMVVDLAKIQAAIQELGAEQVRLAEALREAGQRRHVYQCDMFTRFEDCEASHCREVVHGLRVEAPPEYACSTCGRAIHIGRDGDWSHVDPDDTDHHPAVFAPTAPAPADPVQAQEAAEARALLGIDRAPRPTDG